MPASSSQANAMAPSGFKASQPTEICLLEDDRALHVVSKEFKVVGIVEWGRCNHRRRWVSSTLYRLQAHSFSSAILRSIASGCQQFGAPKVAEDDRMENRLCTFDERR